MALQYLRRCSFDEPQSIKSQGHGLPRNLEERSHSLYILEFIPCLPNCLLRHQERRRKDICFPLMTARLIPRRIRILNSPKCVLIVDEFAFASGKMKDEVTKFVGYRESFASRSVIDVYVYGGGIRALRNKAVDAFVGKSRVKNFEAKFIRNKNRVHCSMTGDS